jgi:lipopolysaccharide heptosyltransferase I
MKSFLIVRLGSLGDVVHAIPVAAALRARYPEARIDWVVDPRYLELLNLVACVDHRVPLDPRAVRGAHGQPGLIHTVRQLRRVGYDAVIDLQGLLKSAVLARAVGARQTIGFPRQHLRESLARVFYTESPDPGGEAHVIYKNLALLAPFDAVETRPRFPIAIPQTPTAASVKHRFETTGYVLVNPCAAWPNKQWPPQRFGQVAAAIGERFGLPSLVLWGPGEQPLAQRVVDASKGAAEESPPTTITDLVSISSGARLMISGDTGPLHIAAAVGIPIVALFGPTRPERNGPWAPEDLTLSRVETCDCHYERRCRRSRPCIDDITVDEVQGAVLRRLTSEARHRGTGD